MGDLPDNSVKAQFPLDPRSIAWLSREVEVWRAEGLITAEQARQLAARYRPEKPGRRRFVAAIAIFGAILVGCGVLLFIASNWQSMPRVVKLIFIAASIILSYGAGYGLRYEKRSQPTVGEALLFLGAIFFGAGIWLVAQIFNLQAHYPDGILYWLAGILPVAAILPSVSMAVLAAVLGCVWTVSQVMEVDAVHFGYLVVCFGLLVPLSFHVRSRAALFLNAAGFFIWLGMTGLVISNSVAFVFTALLLGGLTAVSIDLWLKTTDRAQMSGPVAAAGALLAAGVLFTLSFGDVIEDVMTDSAKGSAVSCLLLILSCLLPGLLALFQARRSSVFSMRRVVEGVGILLFLAALWVFFLPGIWGDSDGFQALLANLMLVGGSLLMLYSGLIQESRFFHGLGTLSFGALIMARYFDAFWELMPRSIFFVLGGILLLGGGYWLENRRKHLESSILAADGGTG